MKELLSAANVTSFLERFYRFYDAWVRGIHFYLMDDKKQSNANIIVTVQDRSTGETKGWVNVSLEIEEMTEFKVIEEKTISVVMSMGLQIGFFDQFVYLNFFPTKHRPAVVDDYKKSNFMIAGKRCFWTVL